MKPVALGRERLAVASPLAAGCLAIAAVLAFLPSEPEIAAATKRALSKPDLSSLVERLAADPRFKIKTFDKVEHKAGAEQLPALPNQQLASVLASGDVDAIIDHASQLDASIPDLTAKISWDLLASNRPALARNVFERRPDRARGSLWRLRIELHRRSDNLPFARTLLAAAAERPHFADPEEFIEAAYTLNYPEVVLLAAERRSIPRLDRRLSLDLAKRAIRARRLDLLTRIDRAGRPEWRLDDPWQAMQLATAAGRTDEALRYAALLPSGQAAARKAIIIASRNPQAIRAMLLTEAAAGGSGQASIAAEQLKEAGFRADAITVLRSACTSASPDDAPCKRLLYLMGPRPNPENLEWLHSRARQAGDWVKPYLDRERSTAALAFVEALPTTNETDTLLLRLKFARLAGNRATASQALRALLDGRKLSAETLSAAAANAPPNLDIRDAIALAQARVDAGIEHPVDRLDLAWAAWNSKDDQQAKKHLRAYLAAKPEDANALGLMAEIEAKQRGKHAGQVWLQKMLTFTPPGSVDRAQVLERMGRTRDALSLVEKLRDQAPTDKRLTLLHARLLVAAGDPGRARKVARQ